MPPDYSLERLLGACRVVVRPFYWMACTLGNVSDTVSVLLLRAKIAGINAT